MARKQYFLLTEILKKAGISSSYLVRLVQDFHISPSWGDIPLPPGTTGHSIGSSGAPNAHPILQVAR